MTATAALRLDLDGLRTMPAQVWGGIRLVPLVRDEPLPGLRLHRELYADGVGVVDVGDHTAYTSYIPHGFVADWGAQPAAAYGTQLRGGRGAPQPVEAMPLHVHRRMARRVAKRRLRFLPLHLALEGYLALHFGGPAIAWEEWSLQALRRGLSPRVEEAYIGAEVSGLADALRVFEIHPGQCGVVLHTADAVAAAFAVPHPDDYRALHTTLVQDLYGDLIHHYALLGAPVQDFVPRLDAGRIGSTADLRAALAVQRREWADFHSGTMAAGLLAPEYTARTVHRAGDFTLRRFLPAFRPRTENHIGEAITAPDGRIAYLKTFRLSEAQIRRGHILSHLAAHDWHIPSAAAALALTPDDLATRIRASGFAHLLRHH
ncbi:hypothetical protein [Streptomyces sp. NPDC049040]|uniref:ARPP-2 domain-containing protein n=1 Tax=Streptomyces sp. NPDC049040 TaxID=3365593 RepID=UPI00371BDD7A